MKIEVIREPVKPPVKEVLLSLSEREALVLASLCGKRPPGTPAGLLYRVFDNAGFGYAHPDYHIANAK